ncbi:TetR/AcrR family transcriptional regulator [Cohnella sp. AR92]|uniref:TetR/AcrR family transcriptional regulator n=1 Tax=Cohnella sp. AR92 TaxID=648716 RepID=UPI000F8F653C|nr:TetR/AcrR family transcriptional regulator [Cohnella sp. AR92]RUS48558.1 TetR/AcrR family transcriptional regulator [Cohnella sp. AR92]
MNKTKPKRSPGRPKVADQAFPMRETVLNSAAQMFLEFGYEPVSINQIAEKAGVTKASVYYYFSNKAQLFTEAISEMMGRIRVSTARILKEEVDYRTRLTTLARVKMSSTHVEFETMMREALSSLSQEQHDRIREAESGIHQALAEFFEQALRDKEIASPLSPMVLAHSFAALLMLGNREEDLSEETDGEELSKLIVDLFWNGIGPRA